MHYVVILVWCFPPKWVFYIDNRAIYYSMDHRADAIKNIAGNNYDWVTIIWEIILDIPHEDTDGECVNLWKGGTNTE